jgi:molybdopterin-binding protein
VQVDLEADVDRQRRRVRATLKVAREDDRRAELAKRAPTSSRCRHRARWRRGSKSHVELSARNEPSGTMTDIKLGGVMAEVSVEIAGGQTLVSVITRTSAERLGLQAGGKVTVISKSTEVMLGK